MDLRLIAFLLFVTAFLFCIAAFATFYWKRSRARAKVEWKHLIARLTFLDRDSIQQVALDHIDDFGGVRDDEGARLLDSSDVWHLIGGMPGLVALERNCEVLIELACYLQRWYPEAMMAAEQLRNDAREIQWHVGRLKDAVIPGKMESEFADYARPAIAGYYLMTRRVLALYEAADFMALAELQRTI
ncbi:MAG TPA: hypothetical protein VFW25_10625 [Silvibacterium sp.]|nr:hypothetical protein [Silvibacterium sp.]